MAIDTGNASSLIRPEVARRLNTHAVYAVQQVTAAGVMRVPAVLLDRVTTGPLTDRAVEAMIGDVCLSAVDGVLGQSWLARHDYLLNYRKNLVVLDADPPVDGLTIALHSSDGRPSFSAKMDGRYVELILDSGTSIVVLFDCNPRPRLKTTLLANGGLTSAGRTTTRIALPGDREWKMQAVCINAPEQLAGMFPAGAFSAVFVSNRGGYLRLTR